MRRRRTRTRRRTLPALRRDGGLPEPDQPLWSAPPTTLRDRLPGRTLSGRDLHDLCTARHPDRTTFNGTGPHDSDDLSLPRARRRCGRQPERLLGDRERGDDGYPSRPQDPTGLSATAVSGNPDRPRVDRLERQRRSGRTTGSSAARARPVRPSSRWHPDRHHLQRHRTPRRRRPTATASVPPTLPAT